MGYGPNGEILDKKKIKNYDPINGKDYSNELFEKKDEIPYSQEMLDTFSSENNFYNFINEYSLYTEEENLENNNEKYSFEDENIQEYWSKEVKSRLDKINKEKEAIYKPINDKISKMNDYSGFEKAEMQRNLINWLEKKSGCFIDSEKMSKEQTLEIVKEFRDAFPEEFAKMINKKILINDLGNFNWIEEEIKRKGKDEKIKEGEEIEKKEENKAPKKQYVSFYPNKEHCSIKYIKNDLSNTKSVFVNGIFNPNSKDKPKRPVLVFCSTPKFLKEKK